MIILATIAPEPHARETAEIDARQGAAVEIADRQPGTEILSVLDDQVPIEYGGGVEWQFAFGNDRSPALGPGIGLVDAYQAPSRCAVIGERVVRRPQISDRSKAC